MKSRPQPPVSVFSVVILYWLATVCFVGAAAVLLILGYPIGLLWLLPGLFTLSIAHGLRRRWRGARWVAIVVSVIGLVSGLSQFGQLGNPGYDLLSVAVSVSVIVMLSAPVSTKQWFSHAHR